MNAICEFFVPDPDDLLATDDGTCGLRDDGCEREKAEGKFLGCWRRSAPATQRNFVKILPAIVGHNLPSLEDLERLRGLLETFMFLARWRQLMKIQDDGALLRLAETIRDYRRRLRFWDPL